MEARPCGGVGRNDYTVERASARKAPRKRKRKRKRLRLVGGVRLGFDHRRQVVESEGFLGGSGAEIYVLEVDHASVV